MSKLETIRAQLLSKYGSLKEPNFEFVREALTEDRYRGLIRVIGAKFEISEDTDPNDDVSFRIVIRMSDGHRALGLSMVGPYAVLLRPIDGSYEVVSPGMPVSSEEASVLGVLQEFAVEPLDQATLSEPIPLELSNTPVDQCRVYQALFTDTDVLPWA